MYAEQFLRYSNIEIFKSMLGHLGLREYAHCAQYLAPNVHADWPYIPAPGCPEQIVGRDALLAFFKSGMDRFEPYRYRFSYIHELLDPDHLIAEYSSHSRFLENGRPYSNRYCAILHFKDGLITYWREYVNPEIVRQAMS